MTPSSKVVGDLALHLVAVGADPADFDANPQNYDIPDSVIGFLGGELGDPPGGWPEPFRTKALQGRTVPLARRRADRGGLGGAGRQGPVRQATLEPAAVPRTDQGLHRAPGRRTATSAGWTRWTTSTGCGPATSTSLGSARASA